MNYHQHFRASERTVEAALVGAGAFGRSLIEQSLNIPQLSVRIAVDISADSAAAAFAAVGMPEENIARCDSPATARDAWDRGLVVAAGSLDLVLDLPFDILVEA